MTRTKINKSAAIKEALAKHRDKGPKEIAALLTKDGIKVTPLYVSNIKSLAQKKIRGGNGKTRPRNGAVSEKNLIAAFEFAQAVGGVSSAQSILNRLATLLN